MQNTDKLKIQNEQFWVDAWKRHIETYLANPPRAGFWIKSHFNKVLSVLEIAGGSCRDSRYLFNQGFNATGTDFDLSTLDYLRKRFPESKFPMLKEDAFAFSFPDKSFDLTFSNGFWVLFPNDNDVSKLIKEQERITRKYLISLIHNGDNEKLVETFRRKAQNDSLYDIRFFYRHEISDLIEQAGIKYKSIKIKKFGGTVDRLFSAKIKRIFPFLYPVLLRLVPRLYDLQSWSNVERIAVIVELV
jgi:hypothetical protein